MKYLVTCLLALPVLTACVEQDQYYERHYYAPAPRVEVQREYANPNYHEHYRQSQPGTEFHGHADTHVGVNPGSQAHGHGGQQNADGHGAHHNAHEQGGQKGPVAQHPNSSTNGHGTGHAASHSNHNPQEQKHLNNDAQVTTH